MKRFMLLLLPFTLCLTALHAGESRIVTDTIRSARLGAPRAYTVYLPPSFKDSPERTYPVLYLLHGLYGKNDDWAGGGGLKPVVDQMLRSGEIPEMVIVTPDAGGGDPAVYQNGYFDVPGWPYEQFFFEEFIPHIEKTYRAGGSKERRAIAGLSMGGGGTTAYAQKHPEMFAAAYPMSALMAIPASDMARRAEIGGKYKATMESVLVNDCVKFVENASPETVDRLRSVAWFVDCGDDDFLLDVNLDFVRAMKEKRIPMELRIRDGIHDWEFWHTALYTALPFVGRHVR